MATSEPITTNRLETRGETKKEIILAVARRDPFLKIEEIAKRADTTPRYVRTILSEARLSLMQLRREYARNMQRRLGVDVTIKGATHGLTDALTDAGRHVAVNQLGVIKTVDAHYARILGVPPTEPLLVLTRVRLVDERPFFVSQIVTNQVLTVDTDVMESSLPLRRALGLEIPGRTVFKDRSVEVIPADEGIARSLGLEPGSPVIQSGNLIVTDGKPVGIEFNYFDAFRVRFVMNNTSDYSLQVIEKLG